MTATTVQRRPHTSKSTRYILEISRRYSNASPGGTPISLEKDALRIAVGTYLLGIAVILHNVAKNGQL